jgi:hypothetical protein
MEEQIRQVTSQLMGLMIMVAIPFAGIRLAWSGLKIIAGKREEAVDCLKQVGLGLFILGNSLTIVWLIKTVVSSTAIKPVGW